MAFFNEADNVTHFEHGDWLGTERMRTDNTGTASMSSFSSLPFGEPNLTSGSDLDGAHFTGMDEDGLFSASSLGLHHATFREYNSILGRWMSPDPYDGSYDLSNPQSFNRYSYALNNPLSLTDPDGEDPSGGLCYLTASNCGAGGGGRWCRRRWLCSWHLRFILTSLCQRAGLRLDSSRQHYHFIGELQPEHLGCHELY